MKGLMLAGVVALGVAGAFAAEVKVVKALPYYEPEALKEATDYQRKCCKIDLRYPADVTGFPTIVWFHGGGLTSGSRHFPRVSPDRIGIVAVEYRLMGKEGVTSAREPISDAAAAVAWTIRYIAEYGGDPKKVYVSGSSAGGYLTMMVGMDPRWLAPYGLKPTDLAGLAPNSGQATTHFAVKQFRNDPRPGTRPVIDEWAPLYYCSADLPPILCITGEPPYEWPGRAEENELLIGTCRNLGHKKVWYVRLPYATHGWTPTCGDGYIEQFALGRFPGQKTED